MINDGGPAFPVSTRPWSEYEPYGHQDSDSTWQYGGMTLRDYFAAKAMQALIPSGQNVDSMKYAESAYALADAMLKARGEQ
jgi:hypothetical protein